MRAVERFRRQPKSFWASVRSLSEQIGYSARSRVATDAIIVPTILQMADAFTKLSLDRRALIQDGEPTQLAIDLRDYFQLRADILVQHVEPRLLNAQQAKDLFDKHRHRLQPTCPIPMNKQKGDKRAAAYLTGLVNMIVQEHIGQAGADFDPRKLTTFTRGGIPFRTLARRVDGAFPSTTNPIAIWEIKEYYYTTTFGSRVADGVYETLLDGMELEDASVNDTDGLPVDHLLIVDAYYTWWNCGKSYLCRIIDMLHMGYVSEVLFGREVEERLPAICDGWMRTLQARG